MQVSRYDSLDSMRGIAAALVVLNHCYCAFADKSEGAVWWLANTPLRMLVSGRPSVILFFVLSGFVLAVSLEKGMKYRDFVVRRFCRIYLPFAASLFVDPEQPVDGQVEISRQRGSRNSAHSPSDCIAR